MLYLREENPTSEGDSMFSTAPRWGIRVLVAAAALALLLSGEQARAQGRLQNRSLGGCQQSGGQAQFNRARQLNTLLQNGGITPAQLQAARQLQSASALQNVLQQLSAYQNTLQQLSVLQQNGQLTVAQLQAAYLLQNSWENALQQLSALQNGGLTPAQVQILS